MISCAHCAGAIRSPRWRSCQRSAASPPPPSDLIAWGQSHRPGRRFIYDPDREWLLCATTNHVAEGRFEHATVLVERYSGCHHVGACPAEPALMTFLPAQRELDTGGRP